MLGQRLLKPIVISVVCLGAGSLSAEDEDALYGEALPADAVFIRHIGDADFPIQKLGHTFTANDFEATAYTAVAAGLLDDAEAGSFYTLLSDGNQTQLIKEPSRDDRSKVHLFLLNAGETEAHLIVADGGQEVIPNVPTGEIATRAVNPLAITLAVATGANTRDFDVVLRRGVNVTFMAEGGQVRLIEHEFGRVISLD